jgi:signal peptidase I
VVGQLFPAPVHPERRHLRYWLAERFHFAPQRRRAVAEFEKQDAARREQLAAQGITRVDDNSAETRQALLMQPWWLDWTAGLFPVILAVFLLRSFLFEPFKIPSGSMKPTLLVGDLILVNKYHYGVRLPVINRKIVAVNDPQRGDVMVFRYPQDPSTDYIKRVVGFPGDEVSFRGQQLYINGQAARSRRPASSTTTIRVVTRRSSSSSSARCSITSSLILKRRLFSGPRRAATFPFHENCSYSAEGVTCKVPPGNYFMMGDNRDNSQDSRYWGFVPDENIVGKAFFVWMNFGDLKRIGSFR